MKIFSRYPLKSLVLGLSLVSNPAIAQVYGLCGLGAGNMTGNLEIASMQIEGGIVLDGTIDCGGICGGGGTASGSLNGDIFGNAEAFSAIVSLESSWYECGYGVGSAALMGTAVGGSVAVGPGTFASGAASLVVGMVSTADGAQAIAIGNATASAGT
ncbi:MAG: hypothetical protein EBS18_04125, partial [Actinobacteria bacterium]|nr:hypothetical protein [Actinomycetota bacterium]